MSLLHLSYLLLIIEILQRIHRAELSFLLNYKLEAGFLHFKIVFSNQLSLFEKCQSFY